MTPQEVNRLYQTLAAVCPTAGVHPTPPANSMSAGNVTIDFDPSATAPQRTAAQNALTAFDWSQGAQDLWDARQLSRQIGRTSAVRLTADRANSTVNLADCTGLEFQLDANASYAFQFDGAYTAAAATTGLQIALNGPAASFLAMGLTVWESVTTQRALMAAAYNTPVLGTNSAAAVALPFRIFGNLTTTAAGLLVVRFCSEVAASAVTIKRGSYGLLFGVN